MWVWSRWVRWMCALGSAGMSAGCVPTPTLLADDAGDGGRRPDDGSVPDRRSDGRHDAGDGGHRPHNASVTESSSDSRTAFDTAACIPTGSCGAGCVDSCGNACTGGACTSPCSSNGLCPSPACEDNCGTPCNWGECTNWSDAGPSVIDGGPTTCIQVFRTTGSQVTACSPAGPDGTCPGPCDGGCVEGCTAKLGASCYVPTDWHALCSNFAIPASCAGGVPTCACAATAICDPLAPAPSYVADVGCIEQAGTMICLIPGFQADGG